MAHHGIIDTHAHIIDPARFPFGAGPGYKPRPDEIGTSEMFCATLDAHGVHHAVLVQLSGYGYDNSALLDAMARHPGRFKAVAVVDPETPERVLTNLAARGVVGVRFNLVSYASDALQRPGAERFLARLKALGWFAQVFADDAQWPETAHMLGKSGVRVLVDHFGARNLALGTKGSGFQAVLALGRGGNAAVKLSAPFRMASEERAFAELEPFAEALIDTFGIENCVWGSDWPFINLPGGFRYDAALRAMDRWLSSPDQREQVLWRNPLRLFGFAA
jgi:predicted TIM-barrel fold metal-dependent hydrolase